MRAVKSRLCGRLFFNFTETRLGPRRREAAQVIFLRVFAGFLPTNNAFTPGLSGSRKGPARSQTPVPQRRLDELAETNFQASARTAQGNMRLVVLWNRVEGDPQRAAGLALCQWMDD